MKPEWRRGVMLMAATLTVTMASAGAVKDAAAGRDPFRPPTRFCTPATEPPQTWRLRGIIGREADFHAWLVYAGGRWERRSAQALLDAHRRLLRVDALSITVGALQGCRPPWKVALKGKLYDQDAIFADSAQPQAGLRRDGAAVAGVR